MRFLIPAERMLVNDLGLVAGEGTRGPVARRQVGGHSRIQRLAFLTDLVLQAAIARKPLGQKRMRAGAIAVGCGITADRAVPSAVMPCHPDCDMPHFAPFPGGDDSRGTGSA